MTDTNFKSGLLASTAVSAILCALAASPAQAYSTFIISAPPPGESYTVVGTEALGPLIVGFGAGEIGTLNVGSGAQLTSGLVGGDGTLIGDAAGSIGKAYVSGTGTNWTDVGSGIVVGRWGSGTLDISGGATVMSEAAHIASDVNSTGLLTISGARSKLTATGGMTVGYGAGSQSTIIVENGGALETVSSGIYLQAGSTMTMSGAGTTVRIGTLHSGTPDTWEDSDGWFYMGGGSASLSDGAYLETDGGYISGSVGHQASMQVSGPGTVWDAHLVVYVGGDGNGTNGDGDLTISNGAQVTTTVMSVGVDPNSTGTLLLTGAGSSLTTVPHAEFTGNAYAGSEGNGTVVVQDGASLSVANQFRIAYAAGSVGVLAIGALEGQAAAAPGSVTATNGIAFGEGNGTLVFNHTSSNLVFGNSLVGESGTVRQIAGTTNLTGNSSGFFGEVAVLGGVLKVNGDLSGASAVVTGGSLGGSGTIGTVTVGNGGWITPGNSIGTIHVAGDYVQQAGGTYGVELNANGASDLIEVAGTAHLGGNVAIAANSTYALGKKYTILTAADVEGSFATTTIPLSLFSEAFVAYSSDAATLQIQKMRSFASAGATANQRAVGGALDALPISNEMVQAIALMQSAGVAQSAFDSLSGEAYASATSIIAQDSIYLRQAVAGRVWQSLDTKAVGGPNAAALGAATGLAVWGQGYGAWGDIDGNGNAASVSRDIGGFFAGVDGAVADGVRVGLLGGYGRSTFEIDDRASSGDIDTYSVGGYGGARLGALGLLGAASYSWNDTSIGRTVAFPGYLGANNASYDLGTTQLFGEANWRFDLSPSGAQTAYGKAWLEPFVAPAYVNLGSADVAEAGSSSALTGTTGGEDLFYVTLGARAATVIKLDNEASLMPRIMLAWQHAFGDVDPSASLAFVGGGLPFNVAGVPIAEDTAVVNAGIDYNFNSKVSAGLTYSGQFGDGLQDNAIKGNLGINF